MTRILNVTVLVAWILALGGALATASTLFTHHTHHEWVMFIAWDTAAAIMSFLVIASTISNMRK